MRERLNDAGRALIAGLFRALAWPLALRFAWLVRRFEADQRALRRRLGVSATTPVRGYDDITRKAIETRAAALGEGVLWAHTSGSTREPKTLAYTARRVRAAKLVFVDVFTRMLAGLGVRRVSLFVMAPLADDTSLTGLMLAERALPSRLACLQAPYRVQGHPRIQALAREHGDAAVRLVLLALANPGVLYATNPSTLATFFDRVDADWPRCRRLAAVLAEAGLRDPILRRVRARLLSRGARARLELICDSPDPLPARSWLPGLEAIVSWDGGYVAPFLERVRLRLPRVRFVPMYSMSTEVIETVGAVHAGEPWFAPLAPGVLYELLPVDAADAPEHLLAATALEPGREYTLVVSDAYGLTRYQTDDVFVCARRVGALPDLRFVRRRSLGYSFTGEKLTGEQLSHAFTTLRTRFPALAGVHLSCMPCFPRAQSVPHYKLLLVGDRAGDLALAELAGAAEEELAAMNPELAAKLASGRLGHFQAHALAVEELVRRVAGAGAVASWEAQFKLLPLYARLWEDPT